MHAFNALGVAGLFITAATVFADSGKLDKPPNQDNLNYLEDGLMKNLPSTESTYSTIAGGLIPQDCANMASDNKFDPSDITAYQVTYHDCPSDPWILCQHHESNTTLDSLIDLFGRLPVQTRQFVRHVISLPATGAHAYNSDGNIAMFDITTLTVFVHESGHSLDLLGAYNHSSYAGDWETDTLSSSANWLYNYNQDSEVPDPYAQSNQIENVAQNTVVASFNVNVPGGVASVNDKWFNIFHQYATVETVARNAGGLLAPDGEAVCSHRLENSALVHPSRRRVRRSLLRRAAPDVGLSDSVLRIPRRSFHTKDSCGKL